MLRIFVIVCLFVCTSFGRKAELQYDLDEILGTVDKKVHVGIEVVSMATGNVVYQKNNMQTFVPASCQKLFTGAAALSILGVDYRFETKIFIDTLGNLFLKGSGDPSLNQSAIREMVAELKRLGIDQVGEIIVDNTVFDGFPQGPGWMWDEPCAYWNSLMDGMSVNHNAIDVWVIPPRELNCPPVIDLEPITNDETVKNETLGAEESDLLVIRPTFPETPAIIVRGKVSVDSGPRLFQIPVLSPPHFAGRMLMAFLEEAKIEVKGKVAVGQMPPECEEVASHTSAPLSEIVEFMMKGSDNLYADMLFKKIGEVCFQPPGSWQKGSQAVREFLRKETNIDPGEIVVLDGSGISRYNLMTPHQLTQLLMWGAKEFKLSPEFMGSLSISGVDGTLKRRMLAAKSKIRAKTGVMTGISTIAGYVSTKSGDTLIFAIMMNGLVRSPKEVKQSVEDEVCVRLTQ